MPNLLLLFSMTLRQNMKKTISTLDILRHIILVLSIFQNHSDYKSPYQKSMWINLSFERNLQLLGVLKSHLNRALASRSCLSLSECDVLLQLHKKKVHVKHITTCHAEVWWCGQRHFVKSYKTSVTYTRIFRLLMPKNSGVIKILQGIKKVEISPLPL